MRFMIAVVVLAFAAPGYAGKNTDACRSRCDSNYQLCLSRAITKQAKKACKADHKSCRGQCK